MSQDKFQKSNHRDNALMTAYYAGNLLALKEIEDNHNPGLLVFLLHFGLTEQEALDILHGYSGSKRNNGVYVRIEHTKETGTGRFLGGYFKAWLYKIARNLATDALRIRQHHRHLPLNIKRVETTAGFGDGEMALVRSCFQSLSLPEREVIGIFLALDDTNFLLFSYAAEILDCNETAVRRRWLSAKVKLKKCLASKNFSGLDSQELQIQLKGLLVEFEKLSRNHLLKMFPSTQDADGITFLVSVQVLLRKESAIEAKIPRREIEKQSPEVFVEFCQRLREKLDQLVKKMSDCWSSLCSSCLSICTLELEICRIQNINEKIARILSNQDLADYEGEIHD